MNVTAPPAPDAAKLKSISGRLTAQLATDMLDAYVASLKAKSDVKINQANLDKR